jgi:hypothetical protein
MDRDGQRSSLGSEVLLRYRYRDGSLQAALPLRVVADEAKQFAGWLSPGTEIMWWALEDGSDPRGIEIGRRFHQRLATAPRVWQGQGVLRVIPWGRPWQVIHFWDESGEFDGWYVNFEQPAVRRSERIDSVDWHLDLWIDRDGSPTWKDEDEAAAAIGAGHLTSVDLETALRAGNSIMADFDAFLALVGDWRDFAPPRDWGPLRLPGDAWPVR